MSARPPLSLLLERWHQADLASEGRYCHFCLCALTRVPLSSAAPRRCPFPVLARSSFGVNGAILPAVLRGLVAAGWFGINSWLGGLAIHQMLQTLTGGSLAGSTVVGWLGITAAQAWCFLAFWALQVRCGWRQWALAAWQRKCRVGLVKELRWCWCCEHAWGSYGYPFQLRRSSPPCNQVAILLKGMEGIRLLEKYSAPILIGLTAALVGWAVHAAGGFGPMLSAPSQFSPGMPRAGQFWQVFWPALSAQLGYWATLALNIPDFSRCVCARHGLGREGVPWQQDCCMTSLTV